MEEMGLRENLQASRSEIPIIGEIISWNLNGLENPAETFENKYKELVLPAYCFCGRRVRSAFTKALHFMERQDLIRRAYEDDTEIRYAIVTEVKDSELRDITFHKKNIIIFDKVTKTIQFKEKVGEEQKRQLYDLFEKFRNLITGREISKIFVKLSLDIGIPMTEGGGLYFIPKSHLSRIDDMVTLLEGTSGTVLRLGVNDHDTYRETMRQVARNDLLGGVERLSREVKHLEETYDKGGIKESVVDRRIRKISRLDQKSSFYKNIGLNEEEIKEGTEQCVRRLRSIRLR